MNMAGIKPQPQVSKWRHMAFLPLGILLQNGQEVKNLTRALRESSQNSHQETAKIARWRNFAKLAT